MKSTTVPHTNQLAKQPQITTYQNKQDQFPTQTGEVTIPLTQFTQNIMGTSVITVKPKTRFLSTQWKGIKAE